MTLSTNRSDKLQKFTHIFPEFKRGFHCSDKKYRVDINQVWGVLCGILMCGKNNFLPRDVVDVRSIIRIYCK